MEAIVYLLPEAAERLAKDSTARLYSWDVNVVARGEDVLYGEPDKEVPGIIVARVPFTLPHADTLREQAVKSLDAAIQAKTAEMHKALMELQARKQDLLAITFDVESSAK
jgi:hypothetical protein